MNTPRKLFAMAVAMVCAGGCVDRFAPQGLAATAVDVTNTCVADLQILLVEASVQGSVEVQEGAERVPPGATGRQAVGSAPGDDDELELRVGPPGQAPRITLPVERDEWVVFSLDPTACAHALGSESGGCEPVLLGDAEDVLTCAPGP